MTEQNRRADDKRAPGKLQWGESVDSAPTKLTDDDITVIWQTMPGGPAGWLKSFGFLQFARAVEEEVAGRCCAQGGDMSDNVRSRAAPSAASIEGLTLAEFEPIASSWDKCDYDGIDSGESLRHDFKRLATQSAKQGAQPSKLTGEHAQIINKQVSEWTRERDRLQDLIDTATGGASQTAPEQAAQVQADVRDQALERAARRVEADCIGFADDDAQLRRIIADIRAMKSKRAGGQ